LFELSDWAYFPYNFKRATSDVLKMVGSQGDFWSILPSYLIKYWFVPLAAIGFVVVLVWGNKLIQKASPFTKPKHPIPVWKRVSIQSFILIVAAGVTLVGIRGGLQYIPIGLRNAVQVTDSRFVPIVLNTPFSIITTLTTPSLEPLHFMSDSDAEKEMPFTHHYFGKQFSKKNVVVLIIESGSKEFTALGGRKSFTPFLDSLMGHSLVCTQAFANGQTSAEGIPAILASIPTLMDEAFTTSNYGTNQISAMPGLLRPLGYKSAFFHGGTNGTMSFDIFASAAEFNKYFGRKEYANEEDYDGAWGIWDEPFLQYSAKKISTLKPPFFASIFTLSSHPPYGLPDKYRHSLPSGPLEVQQCIAYTDLSIREFFQSAAKMPWYDSTLFVITADHCSPKTSGGFYAKGLGQFAIPIIFYAPGDTTLQGYYNEPTQQLDILPSVLQYLGYPYSFFAFGNSIFAKQEPRFVVTKSNGTYQWLEYGYLLRTKEQMSVALYSYPTDSLDQHNLLNFDRSRADSSSWRLKAFIQRYHQVLIQNKMH
ncbi:MAG: LTA synthase family protein, partial [Chitinophagaceae bacterium]